MARSRTFSDAEVREAVANAGVAQAIRQQPAVDFTDAQVHKALSHANGDTLLAGEVLCSWTKVPPPEGDTSPSSTSSAATVAKASTASAAPQDDSAQRQQWRSPWKSSSFNAVGSVIRALSPQLPKAKTKILTEPPVAATRAQDLADAAVGLFSDLARTTSATLIRTTSESVDHALADDPQVGSQRDGFEDFYDYPGTTPRPTERDGFQEFYGYQGSAASANEPGQQPEGLESAWHLPDLDTLEAVLEAPDEDEDKVDSPQKGDSVSRNLWSTFRQMSTMFSEEGSSKRSASPVKRREENRNEEKKEQSRPSRTPTDSSHPLSFSRRDTLLTQGWLPPDEVQRLQTELQTLRAQAKAFEASSQHVASPDSFTSPERSNSLAKSAGAIFEGMATAVEAKPPSPVSPKSIGSPSCGSPPSKVGRLGSKESDGSPKEGAKEASPSKAKAVPAHVPSVKGKGASAPEPKSPSSPTGKGKGPPSPEAKEPPPAKVKGKPPPVKGGGKGPPQPGKAPAAGKASAKGAPAKAKSVVSAKPPPLGRKVEWQALSKESVVGTIFEGLLGWIAVDEHRLVDLYKRKERPSLVRSMSTAKAKVVELLPAQRAQNISIALRKQPVTQEMLDALDKLDFESDVISAEACEVLISAVPTPSEVTMLLGYNGPIEELRNIEQQLIPLARFERPAAGQRLRVMLFGRKMTELASLLRTSFGLMHGAFLEARSSKALKTVLHHTVRLGNYINYGAIEPEDAVAAGFGLDALVRMEMFRSVADSRLNLLHTLITQSTMDDPTLPSRLRSELSSVKTASALQFAPLAEDVAAFKREAGNVATCAKANAEKQQLERLAKQAGDECTALEQKLDEARSAAKETLDYFAVKVKPQETDSKGIELLKLLSRFLDAFENHCKQLESNPKLKMLCTGIETPESPQQDGSPLRPLPAKSGTPGAPRRSLGRPKEDPELAQLHKAAGS